MRDPHPAAVPGAARDEQAVLSTQNPAVESPPVPGGSTGGRDAIVPFDHTLLLFWLLRIACGLEFVGHGAFGIITKAAWVPYFELVGIPERWAYRLMPLVGSVDIFLGFLVLLRPVRAALLYMAVWGLWTA